MEEVSLSAIISFILGALSAANVGMAIVTLTLVQIIKYFLPSKEVDPDGPEGEKPSQWTVKREYQWVPLASAFLIAQILATIIGYFTGMAALAVFVAGLQTGALAVIFWEAWSSVISPLVKRFSGK
jgi:hypothetical protein